LSFFSFFPPKRLPSHMSTTFLGIDSTGDGVRHFSQLGWMTNEPIPAEPTALQNYVFCQFLAPLFDMRRADTSDRAPYHRYSVERLYWLYRWLGPLVLCFQKENYVTSLEYVHLMAVLEVLREAWTSDNFRPFETDRDATHSLHRLGSVAKLQQQQQSQQQQFVVRLSASAPCHLTVSVLCQRSSTVFHTRYRVSCAGIEDLETNGSAAPLSSLPALCEHVSQKLARKHKHSGRHYTPAGYTQSHVQQTGGTCVASSNGTPVVLHSGDVVMALV